MANEGGARINIPIDLTGLFSTTTSLAGKLAGQSGSL